MDCDVTASLNEEMNELISNIPDNAKRTYEANILNIISNIVKEIFLKATLYNMLN
jgi:hypothetical protein